MRFLFYIILSCTFTNINAQSAKISLQFNETRSYCGGAVPTEAVLQELKEKKPFADQTIYVYLKSKCVDSLKTDSLGKISKKLKYGKYNLYLPWKHFKKVPTGELNEYDEECLKKEWQRADAILEVSAKGGLLSNSKIGHQFCPWQYNCLKHRHIPPTAPKQQ
jgi:hypothetical protein